ncbi:uncharacterized protein RJT21DRAFT_4170 [Scheffersomyces amazonensis]|uniref:uncharacterized protein n=1 Tax=Scheffersomyces amazonensis TaxID=1078765 RepID=UPI00315D350E
MSDQEQQQQPAQLEQEQVQQHEQQQPTPAESSTPVAVPAENEVVPEQQQVEQQPQSTPNAEEQPQGELNDQNQQPTTTPASATAGGREVSNKILYVGNIHNSISEDNLKELFLVAGPTQSIKILNDKNKPGFNYAFVEFENTQIADLALRSLNRRILNNTEIKINWAYQSSNVVNNNLTENDEPVFNIFVGDLSPEVDDESLKIAFSKFNSLKQAHVMWDMQTSRSRGYGFVTFSSESDAELALQTMNGEWLNGRAIRCNWASHKQLHNNNGNNINNNNNFRHNPNNRHNNPNNNLHQHHHNLHHNNNANNRLPNQQFRQFNGNINNNINNNNNNGGLLSSQLSGGIPQPHQQQPLNSNLQSNGGAVGSIPPQFQQQNGLPQQQQGVLNPSISANGEINNNNNNNNTNNNNNNNVPVMSPQSYDIVLRQTPSWQTTVYLGNIAHFTQQNDIIPLVQNFGYIVDFKFHPERGCAFVKYDTHERAALAIVQLAGFNVNGRPLKCGWGKDRPPIGQFQNFGRGVPPPPMYGQGRP